MVNLGKMHGSIIAKDLRGSIVLTQSIVHYAKRYNDCQGKILFP